MKWIHLKFTTPLSIIELLFFFEIRMDQFRNSACLFIVVNKTSVERSVL